MTDIVDIPSKVSIPTVMDTITEHYSAKMVALLNDGIEFRVAKIKGTSPSLLLVLLLPNLGTDLCNRGFRIPLPLYN
jgi:hypothetical protein